ncbi:2B1F protein, partial [Hippolais icterina]|nr:2B1F protein [Hippolais icterina]
GAPPDLCPAHAGVFQWMVKAECYYINGTEKVRFIKRFIYNWLQHMMFDSDVGHYMGFTPFGEKQARYWNSNPDTMELIRSQVDTVCRHNYPIVAPFTMQRRVRPSPSQADP